MSPIRAALYTRVSTDQQTTLNQRRELQAYCDARGLTAVEYVDDGISGAKESRPALNALLKDARRRKFDLLIVWKLDRLGRSLRHLILTLDELQSLGVGFVSLTEALDTTTAAGRFQTALLAAVAEYERSLIRERVISGLARAKAQGVRLGRRRATPLPEGAPRGLTVRQAAKLWGCSKSTAAERLRAGQVPAAGQTPKIDARI